MRKDNHVVQDMLASLAGFDAKPLDESKPRLRLPQSFYIASPQLVNDLQIALTNDQNQVQNCFYERVFSKKKLLTATVHRNKRLSFSSEQTCD